MTSLMRAWLGETPGAKILAGDFLERQEAVAVFAVVDKAGFQRGSTRVTTAL